MADKFVVEYQETPEGDWKVAQEFVTREQALSVCEEARRLQRKGTSRWFVRRVEDVPRMEAQ